ncbi:MAG TPA: pirin family protein [Verrucomicrobiae bacterium]|jgi:hypothetical protein|nr:pirin family protein [Verrucomicrobiae bacterium]
MISVRKSRERGHANLGWLETFHTFSFADYYDANHMNFRALRVINEDRVAGGGGFGMHPHRDMEILTYVLSGALQHRDSLSHVAVMKAGEVQRITAGSGIEHSEFNYSPTEPVHLLQIWITPEAQGLTPGYAQKSFVDAPVGGLTLVASRTGRDGSIDIHQDVDLHVGKFAGGQLEHIVAEGRHVWVQVTDGALEVNGVSLQTGDGAAVSGESLLRMASSGVAHFLLFDLP